MKKIIYVLLMMCLAFVISCDDSNNVPQNNDETVKLFILNFGDISTMSTNTRGLVDMTPATGIFDGNFGDACAVMSYFPLFLNLETIEIRPSEIVNYMRNERASFNVFGYKASLYGDSFKLNDDGFYVKYYVMESDQDYEYCVGTVEYYYDFLKQTYSYREIIFLTINPGGDQWQDANVLAFEYTDIPVKLSGDYSLGIKNGEIVDNVIFDLMQISRGENRDISLFRYYPRANFEKDEFTLLLDSEKEELYKIKSLELEKIIENKIGEDFKISSEEEARNLGHDSLKDIMSQYYRNASSIFEHDAQYDKDNYKKYNSHDEFKADSIKELTNSAEKVDDIEYTHDQYLVFNTDNYKIASLQKWDENQYQWDYDSVNSLLENKSLETYDGYKKKGFDQFFNFEKEEYTSELFIKEFIDRIGITNSMWIESHIDEFQKRLADDSWITRE